MAEEPEHVAVGLVRDALARRGIAVDEAALHGGATYLAARQAEVELGRGEIRSALHGVPVAIKDVIFTRGVRTTMGSKTFADFVPDEDATLVARLRARSLPQCLDA